MMTELTKKEAEVWVTSCFWSDYNSPAAIKHREEIERIQIKMDQTPNPQDLLSCEEKICFCMCPVHEERLCCLEDQTNEISELRKEVDLLKKQVATLMVKKVNDEMGFNPSEDAKRARRASD